MNGLRKLLSLGLALALGCRTASSTEPAAANVPNQPNLLVVRLCHALFSVPLERKQACCSKGSAPTTLKGSAPTTLADVCAAELAGAVGRGTVSLEVSGVERCEAALGRELDGCAWVTPLMPTAPRDCSGAIVGKLVEGDACASSLECPGGLFCKGASATTTGRCSKPVVAGTFCAPPFDRLATFTGGPDGRHPDCEGGCLAGKCVAFAPPGGACPSTAFCPTGYQCLASKCEPKEPGADPALKGAGEPCAQPFECRGLACVKTAGAESGVCGDPCGQSR
ncbi:MAG: hypothetical protein HY791_24115 [Deltaproteobacteria bacterium]|nr:hypothetical protein [Deltaproteobacteria bacterium]